MHLWQANLGRGVSIAEFEWNLSRILDEVIPQRALFLPQEVDEADTPEEADTIAFALRKTHRVAGGNTAVPIWVPRHLALLDEDQTLGCNGLARFTPHRPINEALIGISSGLEVGALNFHLPILRPQTLGRRREVRQAARRVAGKYDMGVWAADTNTRIGWPRIAKGEKSVINAGIDKSKAWAPKGWRVTVSDRRTVALSIDGHDAHGARIRWERSA